MKKVRKIVSLLLALVMVLAMSATVFATSGTGTDSFIITVENSVTGSSYNAYKVFDATYSGNATDGYKVSYTIKSTDAWYNLVAGTTQVSVTSTTTGEDGKETTTTTSLSSPFALTETSTSGTYNVSLGTTTDGEGNTVAVNDEDVAAWFNAITPDQLASASITVAATGTGDGGFLDLSVGSAGYYYITTTTGSVVTVTTAKPAATVVDKNQTPGNLDKRANDTDAQIGDTITYTITADVPAYDGETEIKNYTFTDTLGSGLVLPDADKITVKILDSSNNVYAYLTSSTKVTVDGKNGNAVSVSYQTITIKYDPTALTKASAVNTGDTLSTLTSYPSDAKISISYSATVDTDAVYANNNKVTQIWTDDSTGTSDEETVYTYGFNLRKVTKDSSAGSTDETYETLNGAEFQLTYMDGETAKTVGFIPTDSTGNVIYKNSAGELVYRDSSTNNEVPTTWSNVTKYTVCTDTTATGYTTTITVGSALIFGLDADVPYTLTETKAPDGYNLLTGIISVKVGQSKTGDDGETQLLYDENGINTTTTTVENSAGTELPSTGGIGTTVFYIVGGILVAAALVLLITRKRMHSAK